MRRHAADTPRFLLLSYFDFRCCLLSALLRCRALLRCYDADAARGHAVYTARINDACYAFAC